VDGGQNYVFCTLHMRMRLADWLLRLIVLVVSAIKSQKEKDELVARFNVVAKRHGLELTV
jgi:hypothetical protein